jgi:hypothetical protein
MHPHQVGRLAQLHQDELARRSERVRYVRATMAAGGRPWSLRAALDVRLVAVGLRLIELGSARANREKESATR